MPFRCSIVLNYCFLFGKRTNQNARRYLQKKKEIPFPDRHWDDWASEVIITKRFQVHFTWNGHAPLEIHIYKLFLLWDHSENTKKMWSIKKIAHEHDYCAHEHWLWWISQSMSVKFFMTIQLRSKSNTSLSLCFILSWIVCAKRSTINAYSRIACVLYWALFKILNQSNIFNNFHLRSGM